MSWFNRTRRKVDALQAALERERATRLKAESRLAILEADRRDIWEMLDAHEALADKNADTYRFFGALRTQLKHSEKLATARERPPGEARR